MSISLPKRTPFALLSNKEEKYSFQRYNLNKESSKFKQNSDNSMELNKEKPFTLEEQVAKFEKSLNDKKDLTDEEIGQREYILTIKMQSLM